MLSRRFHRINSKTLPIALRFETGQILNVEMWREDQMVYGFDDHARYYRVLDFGIQQRAQPLPIGADEADREWKNTGELGVELQQIDPHTGEGLANPAVLSILVDERGMIPWTGWRLIANSPRRSPESLAAPVGPAVPPTPAADDDVALEAAISELHRSEPERLPGS